MRRNRMLTVIGLILFPLMGVFAHAESSEGQQESERLRLLSAQANDHAKECDQNAANEDRLAQTGPMWARVIHQLAAVKFRNLASQDREKALQYLTQAQELEHKDKAAQPGGVSAAARESTPSPASAGPNWENYLSVMVEPRLESVIEGYLNRNGIKASTVTGNNGAIHYVLVGFAGANGLPNLLYKITALAPFSLGNDAQSQLIAITLETNLKPSLSGEPLYAALEAANRIGNCAWFVDSGEVKCRSWMVIPSSAYPVPAESLRQKIRMINSDWLKFSQPMVAASK
jgi:hypothetical protein